MTPHATQDTTSSQTNGDMSNNSASLTNGETPRSRTLSHLQSYPVVHDTVETLKNTQIGTSTLNLASNTYQSVVAPFHPYLQRPYSVASPYLSKADEFGDNGLTKLETHVPLVKEDTSVLKGYAFAPFNYLTGTWNEQYQRTQHRNGVVKVGLAVISTELKIVQDGCTVFLDYWNAKKGPVKEKLNEKAEQVKQ
ncbi:hypothetical protein EK21DRAFT_114051 [Setomelanomma holmii]|uniref:Uncharacterized protein n=1 Tax=Setomelanomma holmii TaxID=210430 RepID=A0A9P4H717_9PLEO|nr:hypothetical protein EK21DRAFT_114051 [Setomelanomma holmii]